MSPIGPYSGIAAFTPKDSYCLTNRSASVQNNREDGARVGAAGLGDVRAVVLRPAKRRIVRRRWFPRRQDSLPWPRRRIHAPRRSPSQDIEVLRRILWPSTGRSASRSARGIGDAEHIAVALRPRQRVGRRIGDHQRHMLSGQIRRHRQCDSGDYDAGHHIDPVGEHGFRVLARPTSGLPSLSSCTQFDLAAGDLAAGLLDGVLHALELALSKHSKHARGLHQDADLQGIGRKCRRRRLDQKSSGESANDRSRMMVLPEDFVVCDLRVSLSA